MKTAKKMLPVWVVILTVICACASQQKADDALPLSFDLVLGKEWKLIEVRVDNLSTGFSREALGTEFPDFYTLKFQDGTISGRAAPNNYRGPFELGENQGISFNMVAATLMAPLKEPEGLKENEYFKYLEGVYRWDLKGGKLELHGRDEGGKTNVLVFSE
ncbi:MAG: META domain-containing protein [Treponema sp.]|jgi:heat shock protein HslJ|nr:META domain-containing protein [Treponema sp.]